LKIPGYDIDIKNVVKTIKDNNYKTIILQVPEGLKTHLSKFIEYLEDETNTNIIISADPCFGACDILNDDLKNLDVDLIIQIGHNRIPDIEKTPIPTIFVNAVADLDVTKCIEKAIPEMNGEKIGLVTTAQHVTTLEIVSKILTENNFKVVIGKGDNRIESKGQILGCNFSVAKSIVDDIDSFLFIGSGNFHPLGLMLSTKKPVIACDPYTNEVRGKELDDLKDMVLRQRYGAIARSKDARIFGILIGTKLGQQRKRLAYEIREKLDSKQKKSYVFALNHFSPSVIESFRDVDCFVSTACPRIPIDDYIQYKIPIITPVELDIVLGFKKWDDYQFDEILSE
jgi:2-(3-amino-3-carboxypropyl)histidine synthase